MDVKNTNLKTLHFLWRTKKSSEDIFNVVSNGYEYQVLRKSPFGYILFGPLPDGQTVFITEATAGQEIWLKVK